MVSATFPSESSARIYAAVAWRQGDFSCNCTGWRNNRTCWHVEDMKKHPQKYKNNKKTTRVVSQTETTDILSDMKSKLAAAKNNPAMYAQIKTEISFFQIALGAAADAADLEINEAVAKAKEDMNKVETKPAKVAKPVVAAKADDPFGEEV